MQTLRIIRRLSTAPLQATAIKLGDCSRFVRTRGPNGVVRFGSQLGRPDFNRQWRRFASVSANKEEDVEGPREKFSQEENKNAEKYFRTDPKYKTMVFDAEATISLVEGGGKVHPAVRNFISCASNEERTKFPVTADGENSTAIGEVLKDISSVTDEELQLVLYYLRNFAPAEAVREEKFMNVWKALDVECKKRMPTWDMDYLFTMADLWHGLRLSRLSDFHWNVLKRCFRKCDKLTKDQFIRFLFLLNLNRSIPESFGTYDLEYYVGGVVNSLTPMEISIISLAFFKTQTKIKDKNVVDKILDVVTKDASQLESIDVAAVSKFARLTSNAGMRGALMRYQEAFLGEIDRLSIPACTHLALVGTTSNSPHKTLISKVVDKVLINVKEARLKELERISLAMTMFNVECSKLAESIVQELRNPERSEEIRLYGRCLPAILHYLSIINIMPADLISIALAEGFRDTYYGKKWGVYQRELLCLDFSAELEIPNYSGNRLKPRARRNLTGMNLMRPSPPHRLSEYESTVNRIAKSMTERLGGSEYIYPCNVMPHHHSIEIIYCTDASGQAVAVPESYKNIKHVDIKRIPPNDDGVIFHALFICNRHSCSESGELNGAVKLQLRQLKKMGYQVRVVTAADVSSLEMTNRYVHNVLFSPAKQIMVDHK